ncbi:hypothetical protein RhiirC2_859244 [Rhizophagus irregularis]|uniref:Uncharacterized protein n=1 Tax=Rhizophagus irregularis TaxID=588596 RepID=A0A2N1L5J6_9GLOM|nr:hypothetical protein RhiirC2_859244 [Rhizophagus irregularis]
MVYKLNTFKMFMFLIMPLSKWSSGLNESGGGGSGGGGGGGGACSGGSCGSGRCSCGCFSVSFWAM